MNPFAHRTSDDVVSESVLGVSALWMSVMAHGMFVSAVIVVPMLIPRCALTSTEPPAEERVIMQVVKVEPPPPPKVEEVAPPKAEPRPKARKRARVRKAAKRAAALKTAKVAGILGVLSSEGGSGELANVFGSADTLVGSGELGGLLGSEEGAVYGVGGLGLSGSGGGGGGVGLGTIGTVGSGGARARARILVDEVKGDRAMLRRVGRKHLRALSACIDEGGEVTLVVADGRASVAAVKKADRACARKIAAGVRAPIGVEGRVRFRR